MLNLHFLSLLEALLECGSILLSKLLPLWNAILFAYHVQVRTELKTKPNNRSRKVKCSDQLLFYFLATRTFTNEVAKLPRFSTE